MVPHLPHLASCFKNNVTVKQSQYFKISRGIGGENLKIAFVCKARLTGVTFPLHNCGDKNSAW